MSMPPQLPADGVVAPSPLVSPQTLSSLLAVNTTGPVAVPFADRPPLTIKSVVEYSNFTTTPGSIVRVAPAATATSPVTR